MKRFKDPEELLTGLLLAGAVTAICGVVAIVLLSTPGDRWEFAAMGFWFFLPGILLAAFSPIFVPDRSRGMTTHLLWALIISQLLGPVFAGPEGSWMPAAYPAVLGTVVILISAPETFPEFIYTVFLQYPINIINPLLVLSASLCTSLLLQRRYTKLVG